MNPMVLEALKAVLTIAELLLTARKAWDALRDHLHK